MNYEYQMADIAHLLPPGSRAAEASNAHCLGRLYDSMRYGTDPDGRSWGSAAILEAPDGEVRIHLFCPRDEVVPLMTGRRRSHVDLKISTVHGRPGMRTIELITPSTHYVLNPDGSIEERSYEIELP